MEESRKILARAREMGYKLKIHADEIEALGRNWPVSLAVSAEHLLAVTNKGIRKMKQGNVIAVLLPGTSFNLVWASTRARDMIEAGLAIALPPITTQEAVPPRTYSLL